MQLPSGEIVQVTVDVPPGGSLEDIKLPGTIVRPRPRPRRPTRRARARADAGADDARRPPPSPAPAERRRRLAPGQTNSGERVHREREKARKITAGEASSQG